MNRLSFSFLTTFLITSHVTSECNTKNRASQSELKKLLGLEVKLLQEPALSPAAFDSTCTAYHDLDD